MARSRAQKEATVILGREAVTAALSYPERVTRFLEQHMDDVRAECKVIAVMLPQQLKEAVVYAAALEPEMREAIAGAWLKVSTRRLMSRIGMERTDG